MANAITLSKNFVPMLDEVYKMSSVTAFLAGNDSLVRQGLNGKEISYPQIEMSGLSDYDRATGYKTGDVNLTWKTVSPDYDRGKIFSVDRMDNVESVNLAFGRLASEFMRTRVAPEADAWTIAKICQKAGITTLSSDDIIDGESFLSALAVAKTSMDEAEVPETERILFATPTLMNMVLQMETFKSKEVLSAFSQRITIPQSRFYSKITLQDANTATTAGFTKAGDGKDINFLIIHAPAIIRYQKHQAGNVISPEDNQKADAYMLKFRTYGICDVYDNKVKGVYLHHKST